MNDATTRSIDVEELVAETLRERIDGCASVTSPGLAKTGCRTGAHNLWTADPAPSCGLSSDTRPSELLFRSRLAQPRHILVGMADVTQILTAIEAGDLRAAEELLPLVYDELRKLAAARLASEKPGQTLQPTALVHEAYIRLVGDGLPRDWNGRGHFFAAAAEAMRRILINRARDKNRLRRGGGRNRVDLDAFTDPTTLPEADLLELDDALDRLSVTNPQAAELVKLRFFTGLTLSEAAVTLGLSMRSSNRLWAFARAWLIDALDPR